MGTESARSAIWPSEFCTTTRRVKEELPFLKLAAFGDKRTEKGSLRNDANVRWISGIEADFDAGSVPLDDAVEILEKLGCMAIVYTSPSYTDAKPRWRVVCPLSTGMANDRRNHMLGRLNGAIIEIFARESWTLSQSYYFGSVANNPSHRVEIIDGHTIDQLDDLDEFVGSVRLVANATPDATALFQPKHGRMRN